MDYYTELSTLNDEELVQAIGRYKLEHYWADKETELAVRAADRFIVERIEYEQSKFLVKPEDYDQKQVFYINQLNILKDKENIAKTYVFDLLKKANEIKVNIEFFESIQRRRYGIKGFQNRGDGCVGTLSRQL